MRAARMAGATEDSRQAPTPKSSAPPRCSSMKIEPVLGLEREVGETCVRKVVAAHRRHARQSEPQTAARIPIAAAWQSTIVGRRAEWPRAHASTPSSPLRSAMIVKKTCAMLRAATSTVTMLVSDQDRGDRRHEEPHLLRTARANLEPGRPDAGTHTRQLGRRSEVDPPRSNSARPSLPRVFAVQTAGHVERDG